MRTFTHRLPGLIASGHVWQLPLDHGQPDGSKIEVFAREVVAARRQADPALPWLVFLQGGPGFPSPRPGVRGGWLERALRDYRVLLLDQRGTGLSTPVTFQTLAAIGTAEQQADYLKHFRADAIVGDLELIRQDLIGPGGRWSVLGQSYGGFCVTRYLSAAPEGLHEALITGGLPPLNRPVDDVYRATYRRVLERNRRYYERYPEDLDLAREVAERLAGRPVRLPGGGRLTWRRFQQLGIAFGMSDGFEQVHYLLETAFVAGRSGKELSYVFLRGVENALPFETNPIYALLHEPIYCQGGSSRWSAQRLLAEYPQFSLDGGGPFQFTGEMIYPWMFEDYAMLEPLAGCARLLAEYDAWPPLYDLPRLAANPVPAAAAIYCDDMYVERQFSEEAAARISGMRTWVTNEHEHNALRASGEKVLGRLLEMVRGEV